MMTLCFKKNGRTIYEIEILDEISILEEMKILKGYQNLLRQTERLGTGQEKSVTEVTKTHCSKKSLGVSDAIQ